MGEEKKSQRILDNPLSEQGVTSDSIVNQPLIVEEEFYDLVKDNRSIQYEMNMIELPFFCRDDKLRENVTKVYYFSSDRMSYIKVVPGSSQETGFKIPQDFDERIFYAIMVLYKRQGIKIVTTVYELLNLAGIESISQKEYARAKEALSRLKATQYYTRGVLYNREDGKVSQNESQDSLLQQVQFFTTADAPKDLLDYFNPRRKEIVWIVVSEWLHSHIAAKGFLWYDSQKLLEVSNATTRKLYLLIEKWRGREMLMSLSKPTMFLASRIPLSWGKKNIGKTVSYLERSAEELKAQGLIGGWYLDKKSGLDKSELHFFFKEQTSSARLDVMRKLNAMLAVKTGMEEREMYCAESEQTTVFDLIGEPEKAARTALDSILQGLPDSCRTEEWERKLLQYMQDKGEAYVLSNIELTALKATDSFAGFLNGALQGDWGAGLREEKKKAARAAEIAAGRFNEKDVKEWWNSLSKEQRSSVIIEFKAKLGDLTLKFAEMSPAQRQEWESFKAKIFVKEFQAQANEQKQ